MTLVSLRALHILYRDSNRYLKFTLFTVEQSETRRNLLLGKVKKSLNDRSKVSPFLVFVHRIVGHTCYGYIIRSIVLFASRNHSKSNDCHSCKWMKARTLSVSVNIKVTKIKTSIRSAMVLFCFKQLHMSSYLLQLLQMNNCLYYFTLRSSSEILRCWLWFFFRCDRMKLNLITDYHMFPMTW